MRLPRVTRNVAHNISCCLGCWKSARSVIRFFRRFLFRLFYQ